MLITSIYLPNGNPQPGPKSDYKLAWFGRLIDHGTELIKAGVPVVLAGDYNVTPTAHDKYDPDACLIKHYIRCAKLCSHQDRDAKNDWAPIVSV